MTLDVKRASLFSEYAGNTVSNPVYFYSIYSTILCLPLWGKL